MTGSEPSSSPPGGLDPEQVPLFVVLASDDNGFSGRPGSGNEGGLAFFGSLLDGRRNPGGAGGPFGGAVTASYFMVTRFLEPGGAEDPATVRAAWRDLHEQGHEIAVHTHTHSHGLSFEFGQWRDEMRRCRDRLAAPLDRGGVGVPHDRITGFTRQSAQRPSEEMSQTLR